MPSWSKFLAIGLGLLAVAFLAIVFLPPHKNFGLIQLNGEPFEAGKQTSYFVFYTHQLGCPISRRGVAKIIALQSEFKRNGVGFYVINSSPQDTREKFKNDILAYSAEIPGLKDEDQRFIHRFQITRSGHAILFSEKRGLIYSGAIDDQDDYQGTQNTPKIQYLREAIVASLNNNEPTIKETEAKGCLLSLK